MDPALAHAQFTLGHVITIVVAAFGGLSVAGAIIFAGIWERFVKTRVQEQIHAYHLSPGVKEQFVKDVNKVIDDSINRRDGAIQTEIHSRIEDGSAEVIAEMLKLRDDLKSLTDLGKRLGHIEGSMLVIMHALHINMPPQTPGSGPPSGTA